MIRYCSLSIQRSVRTFMTSSTQSQVAKLCIVGGGPAAFYTAQHIIKTFPECEIDILERLPVPFGLVRFGVAPDHPEVKNVINTFTKTAKSPQVRFAGNVNFGIDLSLQELKEAYHAVILTYGAEEDKTFGIPGENLKNIISAREFVGWYNGLPRDKDLNVDLSDENVVILGQGNVAVDAARMLLSPLDELRKTDITEHALATLADSKVKTVYLVGRRGPMQVAFTIKELREMINLKDCSSIFEKEHFQGIPELIPNLVRPRKRLTELLVKSALETNPKPSSKTFRPLFLRSPLSFTGDSKVTGVEFDLNTLQGEEFEHQTAISTGVKESIKSGLVLRSIGYRSVCADPGIPFDKQKGRVINTKGRVDHGVYSAGWLSTGPVGVILSTMSNAFETGANVVDDIRQDIINLNEKKPGLRAILSKLDARGVQTVSFDGWEKIDQEETKRGKALGKPREKIVNIGEMLQIAESGKKLTAKG
ncbi:NADPH:adrenodoxin oxidoreductase, mitochondrial [Frankliniella occidentalis]|uniref:NADPH:adrenodoxin oxidoreductase, mitochondrial n=1 Tax=Frankliniella occidentalis TaxID=133901 RepID=A0A6J1SIZ3_FRAOC|nr:NADPH:adrenodoxin oxidoreductase, mitochondrial [Frankliniella occidentalis]